MIAEKMKGMVANSSAIRAMFEEGNRLAEIYGAENVFDFSLGNPNVPAPEAVNRAITDIVAESECAGSGSSKKSDYRACK